MTFSPITREYSNDPRITEDPECMEIQQIFSSHYVKTGFNEPWVVYFVFNADGAAIGAGGFKGRPKDQKVEITYGIFSRFQGLGLGTELCRQLVQMARRSDPSLTVIARTVPDNTGSIRILTKNGFETADWFTTRRMVRCWSGALRARYPYRSVIRL